LRNGKKQAGAKDHGGREIGALRRKKFRRLAKIPIEAT